MSIARTSWWMIQLPCIARKAENAYWGKSFIWTIVVMTRPGWHKLSNPAVTWMATLIHIQPLTDAPKFFGRIDLEFQLQRLCDCCDCTLHSAGNCFASRIDRSLFHPELYFPHFGWFQTRQQQYNNYLVRLTMLRGVFLDEDQLNRV